MKKLLDSATDSKTYSLLLLFAGISLVGVTIGSLAFSAHLWNEWMEFLQIEVGIGGGRAVVNDGAPKIAAAMNSTKSVEIQQTTSEVTQTTNDWTTMLPDPSKDLSKVPGGV